MTDLDSADFLELGYATSFLAPIGSRHEFLLEKEPSKANTATIARHASGCHGIHEARGLNGPPLVPYTDFRRR